MGTWQWGRGRRAERKETIEDGLQQPASFFSWDIYVVGSHSTHKPGRVSRPTGQLPEAPTPVMQRPQKDTRGRKNGFTRTSHRVIMLCGCNISVHLFVGGMEGWVLWGACLSRKPSQSGAGWVWFSLGASVRIWRQSCLSTQNRRSWAEAYHQQSSFSSIAWLL